MSSTLDSVAQATDANSLPELTREEVERYSRHLLLPEVGALGQRKLKAARVLLVGAGGLGSPAALYLAAAGVGTLGIVDFDVVDVTNLHRQLLHGTSDVGRSKLDSAIDRLREVNPHVIVEPHNVRLTSENALELVRAYDLVVDGTDNFQTRYLVNDACVLLGKANVHGSVFQFDGQASVFATPDAPCYRCLYPEPPPPGLVQNCAEGGVFGVLPGLVGTIQANEVIKLVTGVGETLAGRLLMIDALTMQVRTVHLSRDPECPACGTRTITTLVDYDEFCGTAPMGGAADAVQEITPVELAARLARGEALDVIDVREPAEVAVSRIAGSRHIALGTLRDALPLLDAGREVVVYCRSGKRSAEAARMLGAAGYAGVRSLTGGILRWIDDVEPLLPRG